MSARPADGAPRAIAISGASGFIGRPLCERLRLDGWAVRPLRLRGATEQAAWPADEDDRSRVASVLGGCRAVVHLGGRAHVIGEGGMAQLGLYRAVNRDTTLALARCAADAGVQRFVFVSTARVHGDRSVRPFRFDDRPAPTEPYAISKAEAEAGLHEIARCTGLEVVVVRPPLVYGPGVKANFLRLLKLASLRLPLPLGAIASRRSLVSVWNVVDLLVNCVENPRAAGETFLAGDGEDVPLHALIAQLAGGMGRRAILLPLPSALVGAMAALVGQRETFDKLAATFQVDIEHTRQTLAWQPPVPLAEGLRRTAAWYVERRGRT